MKYLRINKNGNIFTEDAIMREIYDRLKNIKRASSYEEKRSEAIEFLEYLDETLLVSEDSYFFSYSRKYSIDKNYYTYYTKNSEKIINFLSAGSIKDESKFTTKDFKLEFIKLKSGFKRYTMAFLFNGMAIDFVPNNNIIRYYVKYVKFTSNMGSYKAWKYNAKNSDEVMEIYHDLIKKYKEFDKDAIKLFVYLKKTYLPKFKD